MLNELLEDFGLEGELDDTDTDPDYVPSDIEGRNKIITYIYFYHNYN